MHPLADTLSRGAALLGLNLSAEQHVQLLAYVDLLQLWNKAYNLTAIRSPMDMLVKHVLDSLAVLPHLPAGRLLDVGSGGGMPGIVIAIMQPERQCVLVDSNGKKTRFLQHAAMQLKLANVQALHSRVEAVDASVEPFAVITCRAFSSLHELYALSKQLLAPTGRWLAMKGQLPSDEIAQLPTHVQQSVAIIPLQVPLLTEQRHLVVFAL